MTTVGWVSDPNGRGTSGLVISCVLTLGLCVWSALHLNIPPKGESKRSYWMRNIRWILLGVFIPELVILSAWRQWASVRELHQEMKHIIEREEDGLCGSDTEKPSSSHDSSAERTDQKDLTQVSAVGYNLYGTKWTSLHDFYVSMGGFVFDLDEHQGGVSRRSTPISDRHRLTLTPRGVLLLARCGYLPEIKPQDIKDKSKADGLAKSLVLLQATWMIFQTVGRIIQGLPVSLLEVNTVAHVFCAFVVYILWWQKPRDVREPTVLSGEWAEQLAAFMYMSSRISAGHSGGILPSRSKCIPEICQYDYHPVVHRECPSRASYAGAEDQDGNVIAVGAQETAALRLGSGTGSSGYFALNPSIEASPVNRSDVDWPAQQARLHLAAKAVERFPAVRERFTMHEALDSAGPCRLTCPAEQLIVDCAPDWPSDYLLPGLQGEVMGMVLWFASMAYGGIHLAAWHDQFPSYTETVLWRFSAVFISASGFFWFLLNVFAHYSPWASLWWDRFYAMKSHIIQYILLGSGATICGLTYILSRIFLVMDGLASLRSAPSATYDTPDWSVIVPHL